MSVLKVQTTDNGYKSFDELMQYELEERYRDNFILPFDKKYRREKDKWKLDHQPTCIIKCNNKDDALYSLDFTKRFDLKVGFCGNQEGEILVHDDCIMIDVSNVENLDIDIFLGGA